MPRKGKVPTITEPSENQGSEIPGPSHFTRSVSAAKAASDISKDHSNLGATEPQEQRLKKKRDRDPKRPSLSLAKSKGSSSASKKNPKKTLDNLRLETSTSRSRSKNSAERHHINPSVATRVANLEDRENHKRKTPETTPTKSPAAKNLRQITMAGDIVPDVPPHEPADHAGKDQRPIKFSREKLKKSDQKPHLCAIRNHVQKELNIVVPLPPKAPLGLKEAQRVGYWTLTRNMKVVTEAIDLGVQRMMAKLQSNENFDNLSSLGGMRSLVLKHTNEFQEGIQNHLIDYLKDVKSGKWAEIRLGTEFETALAGASQEMSYYIIKVATDKFV